MLQITISLTVNVEENDITRAGYCKKKTRTSEIDIEVDISEIYAGE